MPPPPAQRRRCLRAGVLRDPEPWLPGGREKQPQQEGRYWGSCLTAGTRARTRARRFSNPIDPASFGWRPRRHRGGKDLTPRWKKEEQNKRGGSWVMPRGATSKCGFCQCGLSHRSIMIIHDLQSWLRFCVLCLHQVNPKSIIYIATTGGWSQREIHEFSAWPSWNVSSYVEEYLKVMVCTLLVDYCRLHSSMDGAAISTNKSAGRRWSTLLQPSKVNGELTLGAAPKQLVFFVVSHLSTTVFFRGIRESYHQKGQVLDPVGPFWGFLHLRLLDNNLGCFPRKQPGGRRTQRTKTNGEFAMASFLWLGQILTP